jgi:diadenylate cyclase
VVVVSEERGTISVAHHGTLDVVEAAALNERLEYYVRDVSPQPARRVVREWLLANPGLKAASLLLAGLLWLGLAYGVETVQRQYPGQIQYRNLPAGWAVDESRALQARVTLSGSERHFERFDSTQLAVSLDLSRPREGRADYPLTKQQVTGKGELEAIDVTPSSVSLEIYRVATLDLPVRVRLRNELPRGLTLDRVEARPSRVRVQAPVGESLDAIETEPLDLSKLRGTAAWELHLEFPPRVRLNEGQQAAVEATLHLKAAPANGD